MLDTAQEMIKLAYARLKGQTGVMLVLAWDGSQDGDMVLLSSTQEEGVVKSILETALNDDSEGTILASH